MKEKKSNAAEGIYQRIESSLATALPGGILLLIVITALESVTGGMAHIAGRMWQRHVGRPASMVGGQGGLSARALDAMTNEAFRTGPVQVIFTGSSVLGCTIGGGTSVDLPPQNWVASHVPHSLNLSQEGAEWGTVSLLLRRLMRNPDVQTQKPLLVLDLNEKFLLYYHELTPPFALEMELCSELSGEMEAEFGPICKQLEKGWPKTLTSIKNLSTFLLFGLLGQFDFWMTFGLRAPYYDSNFTLSEKRPYRWILPGLLDAMDFARVQRHNPRPDFHASYENRADALNVNAQFVVNNSRDPGQHKTLWLKSLTRSMIAWPGPVLALWNDHAPGALAVMSPKAQELVRTLSNDFMTRIQQYAREAAKPDLDVVSMQTVAPDAFDYIDRDHLSTSGHRKLAQYIRQRYMGESK